MAELRRSQNNVISEFEISDPTIVAKLKSSKVFEGMTHYSVYSAVE